MSQKERIAMNTTARRCQVFPRTLPNDWRKDPKRRAEILLYDALSLGLPQGWTVFYDVAWLAPVKGEMPEDGQTDFIVVHPDKGALLIEVKGGEIRYDGKDQIWFSKDRHGIEHKINDPFKQVERSKYALLNKLKTVPSLSGAFIAMYDSVAFPDVQVQTTLRLDAPVDVIIDNRSLDTIEQKI